MAAALIAPASRFKTRYNFLGCDDEVIVGAVLECGPYAKSLVFGGSTGAWNDVAKMTWKRFAPEKRALYASTYTLDGEVIRQRVMNVILPAYVKSQQASVVDGLKQEDITPEFEEKQRQLQECKDLYDEWVLAKQGHTKSKEKADALQATLNNDSDHMQSVAMSFHISDKIKKKPQLGVQGAASEPPLKKGPENDVGCGRLSAPPFRGRSGRGGVGRTRR